MIMINIITAIAYVIDGVERALASTDTSLKAKNAAGKIIHDANLTADSWTETFLVAHLYVWFLLSGLWSRCQINSKATTIAKSARSVITSLYDRATGLKSVLTQYTVPQQVVVDIETEPGVLYNANFDYTSSSGQTELQRRDNYTLSSDRSA